MVDVPENLELTAPQARVLGSLMEKQVTTPDSYPMTLKALTTACNQSTSRDPVVDYEAQLVETTVLALKGKGLARVVHPGAGERATKYRQVFDEAFGLAPQEHAVMCVLLVRGAQTVSELRARTERLHHFSGPEEVEATLRALADRSPAMVGPVERQPGQKDARWIQLLEVDPEGRAAAAASSVGGSVSARSGAGAGRVDELEARVAALEARLASLVEQLGDLVDLPDSD
ncbi:MAG: YceH family protein [Acidimicrobiales bacterium]